MGFTLDELLDVTGVKGLSSKPAEKVASAASRGGYDLQKLAARCREAAADRESNAATLREKVAAVAIYRQTISEIDAIENPGQEKVASISLENEAIFVKQALEAGHAPIDVARFIEKQGFVRKMVDWGARKVQGFGAGRQAARARRNWAAGDHLQSEAVKSFGDIARRSDHLKGPAQDAFISKMRSKLGDRAALDMLKGSGATNLTKSKAFKDFEKIVESSNRTTAEKVLDTAKKYKTPALYAGGGAMAYKAMGGAKKPARDDKSGVVVINR